MYWDIFESITFSFWILPLSTGIRLTQQQIQILWIHVWTPEWKKYPTTNLIMCGWWIRILLNLMMCLVSYQNNKPIIYCHTSWSRFSRVKLDIIWYVWTSKFDFNMLHVDREIVESGEKKYRYYFQICKDRA